MRRARWLTVQMVRAPKLMLCLDERDFKGALIANAIRQSDWPEFLPEGSEAAAHKWSIADNILVLVALDASTAQTHTGSQIAAILVHEAFHVYCYWLRHIDEAEPGEEVGAYTLQAISRALFDAYAEQTQ